MADHDEQPRRKRARLACKACNARRVKCNVIESRPCANCIVGNVHCETRESRRGKHPRRPRVPETPVGRSRQNSITALDGAAGSSNVASGPRHHDEMAASHVLASLSGLQSGANVGGSLPENLERPSAAFAREDSSPLPLSEQDRQEDDGAVFLGESTSLRYVTEEQAPTMPTRKRPRLHHSVPNAVKADALIPQWETERRRARMKILHADGAFSFPPTTVREDLLKAYFRWFHPHFPIIDESEFWDAHREGSPSPLLLQAMLFVGVIHCEESTLKQLSWGSRHRAKYLFYSRAKDIYDAEYETKKLIVMQALFLMSFWRAGALLEKDARHWLGAAISLAQTKALHRSASDNDNHVAKLKRRIWWAIYARERQCSSALGLPNRIRDEDCDVEQLLPSDFEAAFDPSTPEAIVQRYIDCMIGVMQLAIFLGRIVDAGYLPNRTLKRSDRTNIREELVKWKQHLPNSITLSSDTGDQPSFQANMLHLAYNNLLILLHRSAFISNEKSDPDAANIALQAAARNSHIVEDMLSDGDISHAQIHVITNLFNTLCIHVAHLRRSSGINRTIAEHRAKLCLLGLQELQRTWEVTNWVLQLFFQYLDRTTAARLTMEADDVGISSAAGHPSSNTNAGDDANRRASNHIQKNSASGGAEAVTTQDAGQLGDLDNVMTPWSWTTDEANQYLFSQIENDFAFGEGGMLDWSPEEVLSGTGVIPDLGFVGLGTLR